MDYPLNTSGPKEVYVQENWVWKFRLNRKRQISTNKNPSENQCMHLNADAGVPLSLRVCLDHVQVHPGTRHECAGDISYILVFREKKCWCMGWNGATAYFNMFLTWTVRVPCRALPRVHLDTVSEIEEQRKVTWLHSVQPVVPLAVLIHGSPLWILHNRYSETEKFPNVGLIWMLLRQKIYSILTVMIKTEI